MYGWIENGIILKTHDKTCLSQQNVWIDEEIGLDSLVE